MMIHNRIKTVLARGILAMKGCVIRRRVGNRDMANRKRGGSNGDGLYLDSARTFAQIGKAFAEALLKIENK